MSGHYNSTPSMIAGGNILPSSFVKVDASADRRVIQAGLGDAVFGISQDGVESLVGGILGDTTYAATAGEPIHVFGLGDLCLLRAGTGGWTRGDFLKPDADGNGIPTTSAGEAYGAQALESVNAGELGLVRVITTGNTEDVGVVTLTANTTLTESDSGKVYLIGAPDLTVTLPPTAAGATFRFVMASAGLSAGTGLAVAPAAGDKFMGNGFTAADGKKLLLSGANDAEGSTITLTGDGADGWYLSNAFSTWTREA